MAPTIYNEIVVFFRIFYMVSSGHKNKNVMSNFLPFWNISRQIKPVVAYYIENNSHEVEPYVGLLNYKMCILLKSTLEKCIG